MPGAVASVMRADPTLASVASLVETRFDQFVGWVGGGWTSTGAF